MSSLSRFRQNDSYILLQADAIMDATKRQVTELKPRSKKKLLLKGPTAEGLESVAKGIKAFSPKSQLQKETAEAESAQLSPVPKIQEPLVNEEKILVPAIRDPLAQRRVEHVSILPRPGDADIEETAAQMPAAAALPWEAYATQSPPLRSMVSASSPALLTPKRDVMYANGDAPKGATGIVKESSSLERRNTTQVTSAVRRHLQPSTTLTTLETGTKNRKKSGEEIKASKKHHRRHRTKPTEKNEAAESNGKQKERVKDPRDKEPHDKDARKQRPSGAKEPADAATPPLEEKRKPSGTKEI